MPPTIKERCRQPWLSEFLNCRKAIFSHLTVSVFPPILPNTSCCGCGVVATRNFPKVASRVRIPSPAQRLERVAFESSLSSIVLHRYSFPRRDVKGRGVCETPFYLFHPKGVCETPLQLAIQFTSHLGALYHRQDCHKTTKATKANDAVLCYNDNELWMTTHDNPPSE